MTDNALHLFEGYGIELEYMIVDKGKLTVMPASDFILRTIHNHEESEEIVRSNEIVMHVIELKTNGPRNSLNNLGKVFQSNINQINNLLRDINAMLLPGGMHPFMNPAKETKIWPYEYSEVYNAYNKIFNCYSHGWANLQSMHINLPYADEHEFAALHASVRLALPLLPALAASSPLVDGKASGFADTRLEVYRTNQKLVPSLVGDVIPEPVFTFAGYKNNILDKIYRDIKKYDREKVLHNEWLNSRGAIARFDRSAIEIRLLDMQEHPGADIAVAAAVSYLVRALVEERFLTHDDQRAFTSQSLKKILIDTIKSENAVIDDEKYLTAFGYNKKNCKARELLKYVINCLYDFYPEFKNYSSDISVIMEQGTLSKRILKSLNKNFSHKNIVATYKHLAECLSKGEPFLA